MVIRGALVVIANRVGALLLGGFFLWQVIEHAGPFKGEAIVHVSERNVDVMIDQWNYRVGTKKNETPITCELSPGWHSLTMRREGKILYEERFSLQPGEEVVLTAWDKTKPRPEPVQLPRLGPLPNWRPPLVRPTAPPRNLLSAQVRPYSHP